MPRTKTPAVKMTRRVLRFSGSGFSRISSSRKQLRVAHVFIRFGTTGLQELIEAEEFAAEGAAVSRVPHPCGFQGAGFVLCLTNLRDSNIITETASGCARFLPLWH